MVPESFVFDVTLPLVLLVLLAAYIARFWVKSNKAYKIIATISLLSWVGGFGSTFFHVNSHVFFAAFCIVPLFCEAVAISLSGRNGKAMIRAIIIASIQTYIAWGYIYYGL